jgi:dTDP-4-amino-4,6-dideoxygalactose transaminase
MKSHNPYTIVAELEERIAEWCGAPYAVAVDSNSMGIFLCLQYLNLGGRWNGLPVLIPNKTYPSIPNSIIHAKMKVQFLDKKWGGEYELMPLNVWDAALRLKKNMYHGGFQVLSLHIKKHIPCGRGGIILCDDEDAYEWLKRARFDGRNPVPLVFDNITQLGWNCYLEPSAAARAIELFEIYRRRYPDGDDDLPVDSQAYCDLSKFSIYQQ